MKVYDTVYKMELDIEDFELYRYMQEGRQIDLELGKEVWDADGYICWDTEHWTAIDRRRFIRTYTHNGVYMKESTGHNEYDLMNDFHPEKAVKVELS